MNVSEKIAAKDLRSALEICESMGQLARIKRRVDPYYEIPDVIRNAGRQPEIPALMFENIEHYPGWRVGASLVSHPLRTAAIYDLPANPMECKLRLMDLLDRPIPAVAVASGSCKDNVITRNIDLKATVPATHGALQSNHFYYQGPVVTKDFQSGKQNLAIYRTCVQGPDTVTVNGRWDRHFGLQLSDAKRDGRSMPVAIILGADPLWLMTAASKLPYGFDDWGLVGAIRGRPIELVKCETSDLMVPANAEVIIEGEIRPPYAMGDDGPWPEYLGYLGMNIHPPLVHVTAITHRNNPISTIFCPNASPEYYGYISAAQFLRHLRSFASSFVVDCTTHPATLHHHAVIKVRKTEAHHEALQLNVALAAFGYGMELDRVTLVDEDIDIYNPSQVEWAVATRCDASKQVHILCNARTHQNNPIAGVKEFDDQPITKAKWIIDATIPWKYRVAEKKPGITFFTRSHWNGLDLKEYFEPDDAARWVKTNDKGKILEGILAPWNADKS